MELEEAQAIAQSWRASTEERQIPITSLDRSKAALLTLDARVAELERQLTGVKVMLRNYYAAMAEEDLDDEAAFRQVLFDWAGI
jgi:hypothetical protein